jgi:putative endonuclease
VAEGEYSVYIVRCGDGSLYTGIAIDVERRMTEHETGPRGSRYLRGRGPLRLEFVQRVGDRGVATRIEYRVKRCDRQQKEQLIAGRCTLAEISGLPELRVAQVAGGCAG